MAQYVYVGDMKVLPAAIDGNPFVFGANSFTLVRKKWVPDSEVIQCPICHEKFNQIRRKHHCRQCGKVVCNKCCENKALLPQLAYEQEPQRICEDCFPVSQLIAKSRSLQFNKKEEAAIGLNMMAQDTKKLQKLVEHGGLQTLIYLTRTINEIIKENVSEALHTLSTHTVLLPILVQAGMIKAICALLSNDEKCEKTLINSVSSLMILCKVEEYKEQAVKEGVIRPILNLCAMKETISLLAVSTLSLLAAHEENLYTLVEKEKDALPKIMNLLRSTDEKMQEVALKILTSLSVGTDWHRHRIVQEHFASGKNLVKVLSTLPLNMQVLVNGCCLLGNLAVGEQDQPVLQDCLESVCKLIRTHIIKKDVQVQIARCLSNFSKHKMNASLLKSYVPDIVHLHLKSEDSLTTFYGVKTVTNLLKYQNQDVIASLNKSDLETYLNAIFSHRRIADTILQCLETDAVEISRPMTL